MLVEIVKARLQIWGSIFLPEVAQHRQHAAQTKTEFASEEFSMDSGELDPLNHKHHNLTSRKWKAKKGIILQESPMKEFNMIPFNKTLLNPGLGYLVILERMILPTMKKMRRQQ